jgi:hypothetical protein
VAGSTQQGRWEHYVTRCHSTSRRFARARAQPTLQWYRSGSATLRVPLTLAKSKQTLQLTQTPQWYPCSAGMQYVMYSPAHPCQRPSKLRHRLLHLLLTSQHFIRCSNFSLNVTHPRQRPRKPGHRLLHLLLISQHIETFSNFELNAAHPCQRPRKPGNRLLHLLLLFQHLTRVSTLCIPMLVCQNSPLQECL